MSDKTVEQIDEEIQKLQDARAEVVRLNEAEKPRFGDYATCSTSSDDDGPSRIFAKTRTNLRGFTKHGMDQGDAGSSCYSVLGNIFDDLEAAGPDGILLPLTSGEVDKLLQEVDFNDLPGGIGLMSVYRKIIAKSDK